MFFTFFKEERLLLAVLLFMRFVSCNVCVYFVYLSCLYNCPYFCFTKRIILECTHMTEDGSMVA
jgi:hypothetical protein